ncbi:MAG TPA: heavy metal translocating P-type ATPase, partial [Chloroflexi bacterium]|nr:heavy metal translocating P-type ATPase [Chloroflexota bacterium]
MHHAHMVADFRRRFWVSLAVTVPVLLLSPFIQELLGIADSITFTGDTYLLWALATIIFFYGGLPFLKGIFSELKSRNPG